MKQMTCKQLGGACDQIFSGATFDEIAAQSKKHGMEMFQKGDAAHVAAMEEMQKTMKDPADFGKWFAGKKAEFESLPDL